MKRILTLLLLYIICGSLAFAESYEPQTVPNPRDINATAYVANPDTVLSYAEVLELERIAAKIDSVSEVELCVVALRDIGEAEAFDFAYELANLWGVGKKERNTGILMLLAVDSRDIQIVTGKGIEGIMTDAQCSLTIDEMIEDLSENRFGDGLIAGAKSIGRKVTTSNAQAELLFGTHYEEPTEAPWNVMSGLLALFGVGYGGSYYLKRKCRKCGERTIKLVKNEVLLAATRRNSGKGRRHYVCQTCGDTFTEDYVIPRKPDDSNFGGGPVIISGGGRSFGGGGGFSGGSFGGGSFGGGGAGRHF